MCPMKSIFGFVVFFFSAVLSIQAQEKMHPLLLINSTDGVRIHEQLSKSALLKASFIEVKAIADKAIAEKIEVPVPKDLAGGYTHEKHKNNYAAMFNAGQVYVVTGEKKYADFIISMLLKYADLIPGLKNHPGARGSSPGRLFHQALNDANWMVYSAIAYDCVYNYASNEQRKRIENGTFRPLCHFLTNDLDEWFNLIHNHGVWACAAVGMSGLVMGDENLVNQALYGGKKDGKSGFFAQMDHLFSPDGYYTEGPYYARYALLPFYLFAESLQNSKPALAVFEYRDKILKKALFAALQQTNSNGAFFPLNDAIKEKTYITNEMVFATNIAFKEYGKDPALLAIARDQHKVILNEGGILVAGALKNQQQPFPVFPYASVSYTDGANGKEGGISIVRNGQGNSQTTLVFKYASHGLTHGHYDALNLLLYNDGNEILSDYGAARFLNVEQKDGGRYLPENKGYASQTIAHNTVVVDEKSQFGGKENIAEKFHSDKLFSDFSKQNVQVVGAEEANAYAQVNLKRVLYMIQLPEGKKMLADLVIATADSLHQYDLPFHYQGSLISTTAQYRPFTNSQQVLGKANGYQYLWKEAEAKANDTTIQLTFLNNNSFYTLSTAIQDTANIYFTRLGANDPDFNLRHEPAFIIRKRGANQSFISVIDVHGKFDAVNESSSGSYSSVKTIRVVKEDDDLIIAEINIDGKILLIIQCKKTFGASVPHSVQLNNALINWNGPFKIIYDGKNL